MTRSTLALLCCAAACGGSGSKPVTQEPPPARSFDLLLPAAVPWCGTSFVQVTARDAALAVATSYRGTIHFTSNDPSAVLPADYSFTAADAGTHSFEVGLRAAGTPSIQISDGVNGINASATSRTTGWCSVGPDHARITSLAGDPRNAAILYASTFGAGVFKTVDGGATWVASSKGLSTSFVTSIIVDPVTPSTLYASGHIGIYKSLDAGANWTQLHAADGVAVILDPSSPATLYAATDAGVNGFGVLRSVNAGVTWTPVNQGLPATTVGMTAIAVDPVAPSVLYAAFQDRTVYVTTDAGAHWSSITVPSSGQDIVGLAVDSHSVVFLGASFSSWSSATHGATWTSQPGFGGFEHVDPRTPFAVYAGGIGPTFKTVDGGTNWTPLNVNDVSAIAAHPNGGAAFAGTLTRGVLRTTDAFGTWVPVNRGLRGSIARAVLADAGQPANVFAATDGSFSVSSDGGGTWTETAIDFDVFSLTRDPQVPTTLYAAGLNGARKSVDSGTKWTTVGTVATVASAPLAVAVAPDDPATVYLGTESAGVLKSTDGGLNVAPTSLAGAWIWSLATDATSAGTVYATTMNGPVFKSIDAGTNWTALSGLPANIDFVPIVVLPDSTVIVAFDGAAFQSRDRGATWTAARGLPPFFFPMGMAPDPRTPGTVFLVILGGAVYKTIDGGASWAAPSGHLPDQMGIFSLAVSGNTLYAATQGRGVFKNFVGGD